MISKRFVRSVVALAFLCAMVQARPLESANVQPRTGNQSTLSGGRPGASRVPGEIIIELQDESAAILREQVKSGAGLLAARSGLPWLDALGRKVGVQDLRALISETGRLHGRPSASRLGGFFVVKLGPGRNEGDAISAYRKEPRVRSAQPNYLYSPDDCALPPALRTIPNDTEYAIQYSHQRTCAEGGWHLETGDSNVVIAVLGSGVQLNHPDLQANIVPGWDFIADDGDPSPEGSPDVVYHETAVAGVAAAVSNNAAGVAGVCWLCRIMPLRIDYSTAQVADAIDFAVANGADVVNMSFGSYMPEDYGPGPDHVVETAVNEAYAAGVVLVASAGNESQRTRRYPGGFDNVIGVGSTDSSDARSTFSNFGSWVDVAAPGTSVRSTLLAGAYGNVTGTSFASPYVAGLAGLLLSGDPSLTPEDVRLRIEHTAEDVGADRTIGSGRVSVLGAVSAVTNPAHFAVIKAPGNNDLVDKGPVPVYGTALGTSYTLEWKPQAAGTWTLFGSGSQIINGVLGTLDASALSIGASYQVRLTSFQGTNGKSHQTSFTIGGDYQSGWPQSVEGPVYGGPIVADVDGNPLNGLEVIASVEGGSVWTFGSGGSLLPNWAQSMNFSVYPAFNVYSSASVGDLDGDGDPEILATNHNNSWVNAWHIDGSNVSGFPAAVGTAVDPPIRGAVALANLDADPGLEFVAINEDSYVNLVDNNGSSLWEHEISTGMQTTAALGDVDGDQQLEIVVRAIDKLYVFETDGSNTPGWPITVGLGNISPVLGDINGDDTVDIVISELLPSSQYYISAYDRNGTALFRSFIGVNDGVNHLALGDLEGDGILEIIATSNLGRKVFAIHGNGLPVQNWPVTLDADPSGPLIADLDGDPGKEVLVGSGDGFLYSWNADASPALQPLQVAGAIAATPAMGDLDGDGDAEIVVGTQGGEIYVFDLPVPWSSSSAEWPMEQADAQHTGHYRFVEAYQDSDGDTYLNVNDCEPNNPSAYPGAYEVCDGIDDDCDGDVDEGYDNDGDGFTDCAGDCNDFDPEVHPGVPELCNFVDDDCDGQADEDFDADGDGYPGCGQDCNDANPAIHPGAAESCNLLDDNCNGSIDEGSAFDMDGDGFTTCEGDCADLDQRINGVEQAGGGWQDISCWDTLDNDCDGTADWDCALVIGDEHLQQGSRAPASGFNPIKPDSVDNTYVTYTETNPGKKLIEYWTLYLPPISLSAFYDLLVEAHRSPTNGNDTFNVTWARRNQDGECTHTTGETYFTGLSVTRPSDPGGNPQLQAFQVGPPAFDTKAFCVKVVDTKLTQDSSPVDSLNVDRLYLMPSRLHVRAVSEFTTTGTGLNGTTYVQTQGPDGVNEVIQESAAPGDGLDHTWKFNVPIGYTHQLHIEAWRTNGDVNDNFQFHYATPSAQDPNQPGAFTPIQGALVDVAMGGINGDFPFGPNLTLSGTVWIRVLDTVSPGSTPQKLNVDYLSIKTTP